ncbi:hypothetical protein LJR084_002475 [Variovorax sp. LjRoot84]|uniref:hypothetical protein n=1 Tax=Variovorax sp. LjRoot84 TaxID=3342340 RepID=UPI003ECDFF75
MPNQYGWSVAPNQPGIDGSATMTASQANVQSISVLHRLHCLYEADAVEGPRLAAESLSEELIEFSVRQAATSGLHARASDGLNGRQRVT